MAIDTEKREDVLYRADPLTFIFRELDLMHNEIREIKSDIKADFAHINKRLDSINDDVNKRFDLMNDSINKRFDTLYLIVILNLVGIVAFLIKGFFF